MALVDGRPRSATASAQTDAELIPSRKGVQSVGGLPAEVCAQFAARVGETRARDHCHHPLKVDATPRIRGRDHGFRDIRFFGGVLDRRHDETTRGIVSAFISSGDRLISMLLVSPATMMTRTMLKGNAGVRTGNVTGWDRIRETNPARENYIASTRRAHDEIPPRKLVELVAGAERPHVMAARWSAPKIADELLRLVAALQIRRPI